MQNIWIYPLDKPAGDELLAQVRTTLQDWKAHEQPVASEVQLVANAFVVVQALSATSGCGIDWQQQAVLQVFAANGYSVQPPTQVYYEDAVGQVQQVPLDQVPHLLAAGELSPQTPVYDVTCVHRGSLQDFRTTLAQSWLQRYLVAG